MYWKKGNLKNKKIAQRGEKRKKMLLEFPLLQSSPLALLPFCGWARVSISLMVPSESLGDYWSTLFIRLPTNTQVQCGMEEAPTYPMTPIYCLAWKRALVDKFMQMEHQRGDREKSRRNSTRTIRWQLRNCLLLCYDENGNQSKHDFLGTKIS